VGVGHAITPRRRRLSCEQAGWPRLRRRDDVPAEVSELLVDALESHGVCVCVCMCSVYVVVVGCGRGRESGTESELVLKRELRVGMFRSVRGSQAVSVGS
jgi:hypothetical protein